MRRRALGLLFGAAALLVARGSVARQDDGVRGATLAVFPAEVRLDDAGDRAALLVQATLADGTTLDLTDVATVALVGPEVARLDSARVLAPCADGRAAVRVAWGDLVADVAVVVSGAGRGRAPSFAQDVLPVLTRAGCNSGSCHGTSRGKDGFHLSLFGYDPAGDHARITRELPARRVDLGLPGESLLLLKATGAVRHTGGGRVAVGSPQHATLLAWLEAGAPVDGPDAPRLLRVELWPPRSVLVVGRDAQRLGVRAVYADGTDRDVTALAALGTSDASVAAVASGAGPARVLPGRRGEAWVTARFADQVVAAQVLVVPDDPTFAFPQEPEDHEVDRLVNAKLRALRLAPAPVCDDATFLRRATLDLNGRLPEPGEVEAFLADAAPDKRARAIDRLLERPELADLWTLLWTERLMVRSSGDRVSEKGARRFAGWVEDQVARGAPFDALVRDLLTVTGPTFERPAGTYFHAEDDPKQLAEDVAQAFLGIRLQCAQCHNHPFDRWTQDDYFGFAAFFAQVGLKASDDPRERVVFDRRGGELQHPVTGKPAAPKLLGGPAPDTKGQDRRAVLARWLTADDNPYFARNLANIIWAHVFGLGIVHEPDDVRVSNPPSNPALLDALADRLRASRYDVKALLRHICTSRAYQRASGEGEPGAAGLDERNHARAVVRRLRAEVLLDAISQATGAPDDLQGLPKGGRAVELTDGAFTTEFLTTFGRATRESPCACEVRITPNLGQALHLLNGDTVNAKVRKGKVVPRLLKEDADPARVVRALYLRTLSRPPTEAEVAALLPLLAGPDPAPALEDVFWALLNSREFLFNH